MFRVADAFEVDGLLLGGAVAIFAAVSAPAGADYPDAPEGSLCIVPGGGVWMKQDGYWQRQAAGTGIEYEELTLHQDGEPTLCMAHDSIVKVRL